MAGDWIKVEQATLDKPEVLRAAEMLNISRREALGLFFDFWVWLDKNLSDICPDFVRNISRKSLDEVLHTPGFSGVLVAIGWGKFDDAQGVLYVTNADRHNGTTAKTRALDAKRKKDKRRENVREMSGSKPDENRTREEKRRDITPIVPTPKFSEFWKIYPGPRKIQKAKCLDLWNKLGLEVVGDQVLLHVSAMAASPDWKRDGGQYVPSPHRYLNERRYEDGTPEQPRPRLVI